MAHPRFNPAADLALRLERIEPEENRRRYYELTLGRSLFDVFARPGRETDDAALPVTLTRRWGRIGRPGRERVELHPNRAAAETALDRWRRAKERRGYAVAGQGA